MTDQELKDFANDAKRLRDAINERYRERGKRQRIDAMDAVELLHAIAKYAVEKEIQS
jgi:hypothetical protein